MLAAPNYRKSEGVHVGITFESSRAIAASAKAALSVDDPLYLALVVEFVERCSERLLP